MKEYWIVIITALLLCITIAVISNYYGNKNCYERFGNGWEFRATNYLFVCVNDNGDIKAL